MWGIFYRHEWRTAVATPVVQSKLAPLRIRFVFRLPVVTA